MPIGHKLLTLIIGNPCKMQDHDFALCLLGIKKN